MKISAFLLHTAVLIHRKMLRPYKTILNKLGHLYMKMNTLVLLTTILSNGKIF